MTNMRENFTMIDIAKFAAAFLVVVAHTSPFRSYSPLADILIRSCMVPVAVPLFFCLSGFLFYEKMAILDREQQKRYLWQYEKRLLLIYAAWSAVYFPFVLHGWLESGSVGWEQVLSYIWRVFFVGSYNTIWFLIALAFSIPIAWLLCLKIGPKGATLTGFFFYAIASICSEAYGLILELPVAGEGLQQYLHAFYGFKNGLFFGLVFVSLGMFVSQQRKLGKQSQYLVDVNRNTPPCTTCCAQEPWRLLCGRNLICVCLCMFFMSLETAAELLLQHVWRIPTFGCDFKITLVPVIYFLILFILDAKSGISSSLSMWLRKLSMLMFLTQRLLMELVDALIARHLLSDNSLLYVALVFSGTMVLSILIIHLTKCVPGLKCIY